MRKLDNAIDDVSSARSDDFIAGVTDSSLFEIMAASATRDAKDSIESAKSAVLHFGKLLEDYQVKVQTHHLHKAQEIESVNPTSQLVIDLVFDTNLMDWVNYFALGEIDNQLDEVKEKVTDIHNKLNADFQDIERKMNGEVCRVRNLCRSL